MKNKRIWLFLLLPCILLLFACGSSKSSESGAAYRAENYVSETQAVNYEEAGMTELSKTSVADTAPIEVKPTASQRKLIKNVNMTVETKNFDEYIKGVQRNVEELGGYVSNFSLSDTSYDGYSYDNAYASIELRVPADSLDTLLSIVQEGVNVRNQDISTTDVTLTYSDTESRIKALTVEQDRLMELIAQAESVDAIIVIETRLSEVRYQLESYNSQLRLMDNQIQYSTVYLSVYDVQEYQTTKDTSYFEKIRIGFTENLNELFEFISEVFLALITSLPTLIFLAAILFVVILLLRKFKIKPAFRFKKGKKAKSSENDMHEADSENVRSGSDNKTSASERGSDETQ